MAATSPCRQEMAKRLGNAGDHADCAACRLRWNARTVMSMGRRRCGEVLRLKTMQQAQALLKAVVYNIQRPGILDFPS